MEPGFEIAPNKRRVEGHIRGIEEYGAQAHSVHRGFRDVEGRTDHVRGLIDYVNDVQPNLAIIMPRFSVRVAKLGGR